MPRAVKLGCGPKSQHWSLEITIPVTVNSGELRILYSVPVCMTGNIWLVKFNGFVLQPMAKQTINFPSRNPYRNTDPNSKYTVCGTVKTAGTSVTFHVCIF